MLRGIEEPGKPFTVFRALKLLTCLEYARIHRPFRYPENLGNLQVSRTLAHFPQVPTRSLVPRCPARALLAENLPLGRMSPRDPCFHAPKTEPRLVAPNSHLVFPRVEPPRDLSQFEPAILEPVGLAACDA